MNHNTNTYKSSSNLSSNNISSNNNNAERNFDKMKFNKVVSKLRIGEIPTGFLPQGPIVEKDLGKMRNQTKAEDLKIPSSNLRPEPHLYMYNQGVHFHLSKQVSSYSITFQSQ